MRRDLLAAVWGCVLAVASAGGAGGIRVGSMPLGHVFLTGSRLDFAITPGPPGSTQHFDASALAVRIADAP